MIRGEVPQHTPVWFMRQAGRSQAAQAGARKDRFADDADRRKKPSDPAHVRGRGAGGGAPAAHGGGPGNLGHHHGKPRPNQAHRRSRGQVSRALD